VQSVVENENCRLAPAGQRTRKITAETAETAEVNYELSPFLRSQRAPPVPIHIGAVKPALKSEIFNQTRRGFGPEIRKSKIFFTPAPATTYRNSSDKKKGNFRLKRAGPPFYRELT
jgi:hypothetical protein